MCKCIWTTYVRASTMHRRSVEVVLSLIISERIALKQNKTQTAE